MAGNNDRRQRRGQVEPSTAMPPIVVELRGDRARTRGEAPLSVAEVAPPGLRGDRAQTRGVTPLPVVEVAPPGLRGDRAQTRGVTPPPVVEVAPPGLRGDRAQTRGVAPPPMVEVALPGLRGDRAQTRGVAPPPDEPSAPAAPLTGAAATRRTRGQGGYSPAMPPVVVEAAPTGPRQGRRRPRGGAQPRGEPSAPTQTEQTQGQGLTEVALPPLTQRQIWQNAAAQLSQYNTAELAALQGLLPPAVQAPSVEEQVKQTLLDRAVARRQYSLRPEASVEEAAAGEAAFLQELLQILDPNALLVPTE